MSADVSKCPVCGKKLSPLSKAVTCSGRCRTRKSRLGQDFGKNCMLARNILRELALTLDLDETDTWTSFEEIEEIKRQFEKFIEAHNSRYDREIRARGNQ